MIPVANCNCCKVTIKGPGNDSPDSLVYRLPDSHPHHLPERLSVAQIPRSDVLQQFVPGAAQVRPVFVQVLKIIFIYKTKFPELRGKLIVQVLTKIVFYEIKMKEIFFNVKG